MELSPQRLKIVRSRFAAQSPRPPHYFYIREFLVLMCFRIMTELHSVIKLINKQVTSPAPLLGRTNGMWPLNVRVGVDRSMHDISEALADKTARYIAV